MILTALFLSAALAADTPDTKSGDMQSCPMHAQHVAEASAAKEPATHSGHAEGSAEGDHAAMVNHNHDSFGMSHGATTHHFRLFADGGAIELRANDAKDVGSIEAIRTHLREIAGAFSAADFAKPVFVHGRTPDGVETMKAMKTAITYRYEELPEGGRVRITSEEPKAVAAVHSFLRFQIDEHRTGDPGKPE